MVGNVFVSPSGVVEDFTESPGKRGTRVSGSERGGRATGLAKGDVQRGKSGVGAEMRSIPHERRRRERRRKAPAILAISSRVAQFSFRELCCRWRTGRSYRHVSLESL